MSLTKVSPSLFQVSNNITSTTVGGSANTISLTFDSNGVITGASNNALSVANTLITGTITAAQIAAVNGAVITANTVANSAFLRANVLVRVGNVVPSNPAAVLGNLWWNTDLGKLFIYYVDGDSSQWVETGPSVNTQFISAGSTKIGRAHV